MIASGSGVVIYGGGWQRGIAQRLQAAVSFSSRESVDFPAPGCAPPVGQIPMATSLCIEQ